MAVSGAWKNKQQVAYSGAMRQGTGWNPVHAIRDNDGRNIAPDGNSGEVPDDITAHDDDPTYGYMSEDASSTLWGYGTETGTADRPALDSPFERQSTGDYPPAGQLYRSGIPGGSFIRGQDHGAEASVTAKAVQPDATQGWEDKLVGDIEDAEPSNPAQYERQTSMQQMKMDRAGSQRGGGSASEYSAPVPGRRRTMGQRLLIMSGRERHAEMAPRRQDLILRPFQYRTAGTGNPDDMLPNEMYMSTPLQRTPNADPWQGLEVPALPVPGFVDEGWNI